MKKAGSKVQYCYVAILIFLYKVSYDIVKLSQEPYGTVIKRFMALLRFNNNGIGVQKVS